MTRPPTGSIPDAPGSYQFLDADGRVLYVGKAKSLRQRLSSYFQDPAALAPRTAQMVAQADHVEWMVVDSESEALLLEHNLIKELQPRFNVRLKDDKSYPWLAVTVGDEWPRPAVVRGRKRSGVRYFGPYPNVGAIRETLNLLLRSFPVRTCSDTKLQRHQRLGRPCLLFHIEPVLGPVRRRRDGRSTTPWWPISCRSSAGTPRRWSGGSRSRCATLRGPGIRTGLGGAGQTRGRPGGRRRAADGAGPSGGPRRLRDRRGRAGGGRPGLPRALGQGGRAFGVVRGQGRGPHPGALVGRILVDAYDDAAAGVPRQVLVPVLPTISPGSPTTSPAGGGTGGPAGPRRGAKRALLQTVERNAGESLPAPPDAADRRPQQPGPGARVPAAGARPAGGPAAHRVLRHEPPAGDGLRGLDGRLRGRPGQEVPTTGTSGWPPCRATTTTPPWRRSSPVG